MNTTYSIKLPRIQMVTRGLLFAVKNLVLRARSGAFGYAVLCFSKESPTPGPSAGVRRQKTEWS